MVTHRAGAEVSRRPIARVLVTTGLLVLLTGTYRASADPVFVETGATAFDIEFTHNYSLEVEHGRKNGPGAAAGDYDHDGWVDLYVTNGWGFANRLYRNNGDGTFTDVAGEVGADLVLVERESKGALFLDYDGDGWLDLFLLNDSDAYDPAFEEPPETMQNQLFRNLGNGQFVDVTESAQIPTHPYRDYFGVGYGQVGGVAAGDLNGDGYPEIYIAYWGDIDTLLRNNGDQTFTDVTDSAGIGTLDKNNWAPIMWDFDGDGFLDIQVCVDLQQPNQLFINQDDLTFVDEAVASGLNIAKWSEMGAALGDYDNDGDFDLYMTNIEHPGKIVETDEPAEKWNRFMRNDSTPGDMNFVDIGGPLVEFVRTGWGWGVTFVDYDHDGWLDLAVVNGQAVDDGIYNYDQSKLFRNDGPDLDDPEGLPGWLFTDVSTDVGFDDTREAKALIALDYDRDGDQDLFVTNHLEAALLYRNDGGNTSGNWLVVDPIGDLPNTEAIGATIYVEAGGMTQMRFITAGTSYLSQEPSLAHFGVGSATTIDSVRVVWADGTEDVATNVPSNQYVDFIQGEGIPAKPQGDPISLAITGPSTVAEEVIVVYTATAEYENGSSADVTADSIWTVTVGGEYAEFDDTNPGTLTTLLLDSLEQTDLTIQAVFETLSATQSVSLVDSTFDVVGPTLGINDLAMTTEESMVTISGTAEDASGVLSVAWSSDQGSSGPCSGLADWYTGPIALTEGDNLITITARDGLQNEASVEVSMTYTIPQPPEPPSVPPPDPEEPEDEDPDVTEPETPDDTTDPEPDDDATPDDGAQEPPPDDDDDGPVAGPTGLCGGMGLIGGPLIAASLCALRRRVGLDS